jgi:hypothetical protein
VVLTGAKKQAGAEAADLLDSSRMPESGLLFDGHHFAG